ncbi:hypothetical protein Q5P01_009347 [Channa striata]|uniref:Uncharacterized protein n=1 Tax=Channa striata TaxID=64152 RepID=A0AA88SUZ1_CHASR|nr:hypothetical protein Q5P01_009347 [Channa striata]
MDLFEFDFFRDWELEQPCRVSGEGWWFCDSQTPAAMTHASGESASGESVTHCCPSAATMEGPWSRVLNPPLLEWSSSGLNNKLGVSAHVTLPLPPLHHAAAVSGL